MRTVLALLLVAAPALAQEKSKGAPTLDYPPTLPGGKTCVTDQSAEFLKAAATLREGVEIARTAPTVDFLYYPGQDYPGRPWSVWGDGCASGDKYYSAIGDHAAPKGTALLFEYDSTARKFRLLADVRKVLESAGAIPAGMNYSPGKIHSRIDLGSDGWLYYSTHRGSPGTTTDQNGYKGDWIFRTHPESGKTEIVATHPVPKHCIPASVLDPERLIFYGGTAHGKDAPAQGVQFLAFDAREKKVLLATPGGFDRCAIFSRSTGCLYWSGKKYDPKTSTIPASEAPGVRSATEETPQGIVYGTPSGEASGPSHARSELYAFDVKTEKVAWLGSAVVGKQAYITTIDADPTGRYLYYIPGAHGGGPVDGTPVVQFDVKTRKRKVIAFLHPFYANTVGYTLEGTFGSALDPKGEKLYVTWNGQRKGSKGWESCALTVIHIPASERP